MKTKLIVLIFAIIAVSCEDNLNKWAGLEASFDVQKIYDSERFPSIVAAKDGSIVTTWGNTKIVARRSEDGGKTWSKTITIANHDILLFSNIISEDGRKNGYVWASFDGGKRWPVKRCVEKGSFAYSSMTAGRNNTASEGYIYLIYESDDGAKVARFNMAWLLDGKKIKDYLK